MGSDFVIHLMQDAISLTAKLGLPLLGSVLVVGVIISLFQAVTQIQEMTLTFVPKMIVAGLIIYLMGPWMLDQLMQFSHKIFAEMLLVK